ncbi:hypothetical protein BRAS3843_1920011 [Bradyrhizobium sp. STM 3843]|nr:hypothetical protein BRAS3843_1920011 [Bradyrhizobium sp. STM 3843]
MAGDVGERPPAALALEAQAVRESPAKIVYNMIHLSILIDEWKSLRKSYGREQSSLCPLPARLSAGVEMPVSIV